MSNRSYNRYLLLSVLDDLSLFTDVLGDCLLNNSWRDGLVCLSRADTSLAEDLSSCGRDA